MPTPPPKLLDYAREVLRARHYASRAGRSYVLELPVEVPVSVLTARKPRRLPGALAMQLAALVSERKVRYS